MGDRAGPTPAAEATGGVWSLVVEGEPVEERFVLRAGRFVELAEDAE
jgi:hypothetical protein